MQRTNTLISAAIVAASALAGCSNNQDCRSIQNPITRAQCYSQQGYGGGQSAGMYYYGGAYYPYPRGYVAPVSRSWGGSISEGVGSFGRAGFSFGG
jgi:hypothetical protein